MRLGSAIAILVSLSACGGSAAPSLAGPDDAGVRLEAAADAACLATPVEGSACTQGQSVCSEGGNICCIGYVWECDPTTNTWEKEGLGCACLPAPLDAGPFACGPTMTCGGAQMCTDHPPGIEGPDGSTLPDAYECDSLPPACASTPTCGCVVQELEGSECTVSSCDDDGAGHITVHCLGV